MGVTVIGFAKHFGHDHNCLQAFSLFEFLMKFCLETKIEVLKRDYPALYIEYCKYFGLKTKIDDYIAECLELKEAGVYRYAQYMYGGVIPTLEIQRE